MIRNFRHKGLERLFVASTTRGIPTEHRARIQRVVEIEAGGRAGSAEPQDLTDPEVELIEPTPDPDLNHALLDSLRRWRFFPATQGGRPVASTIEIRIPVSVR